MEKQGVIKPGLTPPEENEEGVKKSDDQLEDHLAKRTADAAWQKLLDAAKCDKDSEGFYK
jgi:hypothetical protein